MGTSNSSRITLQEFPSALPGACGLCGGVEDREFFADFKLDFEFYGVLYFCSTCCNELANLCGYAKPEEVVATQSRAAEILAENLVLKQKLKAAEAYIRESFSIDPGSILGTTADDVLDAPVIMDEEGTSEEGLDDSAAVKLTVVEGPDDVRNITDTEPNSTLSL